MGPEALYFRVVRLSVHVYICAHMCRCLDGGILRPACCRQPLVLRSSVSENCIAATAVCWCCVQIMRKLWMLRWVPWQSRQLTTMRWMREQPVRTLTRLVLLHDHSRRSVGPDVSLFKFSSNNIIGCSDITESMVTIWLSFCGYNTM